MTSLLVLSPLARADIIDVLEWSIDHFGGTVRDGYEALIDAALRDIATDPRLAGSHERPELGQYIRSVHLATSREHVSEDVRRIPDPRHFVFYRHLSDVVQVSRVLHEARDFVEHRFP